MPHQRKLDRAHLSFEFIRAIRAKVGNGYRKEVMKFGIPEGTFQQWLTGQNKAPINDERLLSFADSIGVSKAIIFENF